MQWRAGILVSVLSVMAMASSPRPGFAAETMKNSLDMSLTLVPAGEFMMGADEDKAQTLKFFPYCDPKWLDGELPRHKVRITKPFWMGTYEVTLGQFLQFYHGANYKLDIERDGKKSWGFAKDGKLIESTEWRPWAPGRPIENDHPVVYVSWNDATVFCKWLSRKEGKTYRLPTEAEWEYACRAGSKGRFSFGDDVQDLVKNANAADQDRKLIYGSSAVMIASFDENGKKTDTNIPYPYLKGHDGFGWTAPVGKYQPNAFGLHDMHGNVWEWCSDWYDGGFYANSPTDDPQGPDSGWSHVARGGGFYGMPVFCRSAYRDNVDPAVRNYNFGFRVVCEEKAETADDK